MIIAIDGPAAAGKGTLAQNLAKHFHYAFLDTGRLYRAVGYAVLQAGEDPSDESAATREAKSFDPKSINKILSNPALRDEATGNAASKVAVIPAVRSALLDLQRNFAKKLIESGNADAALVAFYAEDDPKWRLSFVRLDYEMKIENGKLKAMENLTPAKRYSFLVGDKEPCHTALSHFHSFIVDNNSNPTLDELEEAFSVERVTQEFFDLYCEKYQQLRDWLVSNEDFVAESERCHFTVEQFAKKLLGQIVFLYFLQKKGWLGVGVWPQMLTEKEYKNLFFTPGAQGRIIKEYLPILYVQSGENYVQTSRFRSALDQIPDDAEELIANKMPHSRNWGSGSQTFLRTLFDYATKNGGHFYEKYLEPLFYDTLNKNRGVLGYTPILHCRIPFLSGGLFEPIDGERPPIQNVVADFAGFASEHQSLRFKSKGRLNGDDGIFVLRVRQKQEFGQNGPAHAFGCKSQRPKAAVDFPVIGADRLNRG